MIMPWFKQDRVKLTGTRSYNECSGLHGDPSPQNIGHVLISGPVSITLYGKIVTISLCGKNSGQESGKEEIILDYESGP